jgi:uncharacterized cupredoxin-like copper-binding protein
LRIRIALLLSALAALAVIGPASAARTHSSATVKIKIKVVATEYSFTFSKASAKKGSTVVFTVKNTGAIPHNLVFTSLGKATPMIAPGASRTLTIKFAKAGRFPYICSVPRHAEQGMAGSFLVK